MGVIETALEDKCETGACIGTRDLGLVEEGVCYCEEGTGTGEAWVWLSRLMTLRLVEEKGR